MPWKVVSLPLLEWFVQSWTATWKCVAGIQVLNGKVVNTLNYSEVSTILEIL